MFGEGVLDFGVELVGAEFELEESWFGGGGWEVDCAWGLTWQ